MKSAKQWLHKLRLRLKRSDLDQARYRPRLVREPTDRDNPVSLAPYVDFREREQR